MKACKWRCEKLVCQKLDTKYTSVVTLNQIMSTNLFQAIYIEILCYKQNVVLVMLDVLAGQSYLLETNLSTQMSFMILDISKA